MNILNATILLRRDNDYNFKKVENFFVPANGEVVLVDTAKDGLRVKVGDGYSTFAQLQYTDADLRNPVLHGYYYNSGFYLDAMHTIPMVRMMNKIYIDDSARKVYYFDGTNYICIQDHFVNATSDIPGIVKLYDTKGNNIDGTITLKLFTDEIDKKVEININTEDELIIFSI